jgi:hypothetical protein
VHKVAEKTQAGRVRIFRSLVLVGLGLMVWSFFSPMWWVSLKAPNYPEHTFPQGVRILMHWDSVRNGCEIRENTEVFEDEPLDCVHEMNTINHYIGMKPIEEGARIEFAAAPYLFAGFGLLLLISLFYTGPLWWLLAVPAIIAPAAFLIDFVAWMWWFGHNLHEWAAFTLKPFMPTVFGEGMVAQFSTFAYPHVGFPMSVASSLCLIVAVLIRRKQLREANAP